MSVQIVHSRICDNLLSSLFILFNGTYVIPHPSADDQPKCIACKTTVSLHMVMPKNLAEGKRYELDYCNACMHVAEAEGEIFIDNPARCGCPAVRYATELDCESC